MEATEPIADETNDAEASVAEVLRPRPGRDAVGWLSSFAVHAVVCLAMALATLPPLPFAATFDLFGEPVPAEQLDDAFQLDEAIALSTDDLSETLDSASMQSPVALPTPDMTASVPVATIPMSDLLPTSLMATPTDLSAAVVAGEGTDGRSTSGKAALIAAKGGSRASELAVARGLKWLVEHQSPDGSWSLIHTAGACRGRCANPSTVRGEDPVGRSRASATGLALLPFLGAGETHESGRYRRQVRAGLNSLISMGRPDEGNPGLSWADSGNLYAHGICTIVLCEAYALTGDPEFRRPAQAALDYLSYAQDPRGGGWRYSPQERGDTSVTGWQILGFKSGLLGGLQVAPRVVERANRFLDAVSSKSGTAFGYTVPGKPEPGEKPRRLATNPTRTAIGLLCRQFLGWEQDDPRLVKAVTGLAERGPIKGHYYHNYYAAQAIFHQTGGVGPVWRQWNEVLREQLIKTQARRGHEKGSWWAKGNHNERGGRLYSTALATMTLEVYYRYLPLYQETAVATELPD